MKLIYYIAFLIISLVILFLILKQFKIIDFYDDTTCLAECHNGCYPNCSGDQTCIDNCTQMCADECKCDYLGCYDCTKANQSVGENNYPCCDGSKPRDGRCPLSSGYLGSCNMGNSKNKKIIVMRHGHDKSGRDTGPFTAVLPDLSTKTYNVQWLSTHGEFEALQYAKALPNFIKNFDIAPVVKVATQDPGETDWDSTSNPFRTIYNFITNCNIRDVEFTKDKIPYEGTLSTENLNGSLLICSTSQLINGPAKNPDNPEGGSILRKLMDRLGIGTIKSPPHKSNQIYVFDEKNGTLDYFYFDVEKDEIIPCPTPENCNWDAV